MTGNIIGKTVRFPEPRGPIIPDGISDESFAEGLAEDEDGLIGVVKWQRDGRVGIAVPGRYGLVFANASECSAPTEAGR